MVGYDGEVSHLSLPTDLLRYFGMLCGLRVG